MKTVLVALGMLVSSTALATDCESLVKDAATAIDYKDSILALSTLKEDEYLKRTCLPQYITERLKQVLANTELQYQSASVYEYRTLCSNALYKDKNILIEPETWIQIKPYVFEHNFNQCEIILNNGTQVKILH